ncbi:MAG: hypothetical protein ACQETH_06465 [Candidatus Rifleibacteriota bacterium]
MKGEGFVNLPSWQDKLPEIFNRLNRQDLLRIPVLGLENVEKPWVAFEEEDFFAAVETGIIFNSEREFKRLPEKVVTSDACLALQRLDDDKLADTFFSSAIGATYPVMDAFASAYSSEKPGKLFTQNDSVTGFILSRMESRNCSLEKATYEAQWEKIAPSNPSFHLHGIITRNRLALQIVKIFKRLLPVNDIPTAGIETLDLEDIRIAADFGCAVRLLGIASKTGDKIKASVEPCIIPEKYLLAQVRGGTEIIYTLDKKGDSKTFCCGGTDYENIVGGLLFDLDRIDRKVEDIVKQPDVEGFAENYYVRLNLMEINDTLSQVLKLLSQNGIEVETLMQPKKEVSRETENSVSFGFTFITSKIERSKLNQAVDEINQNIKLATVCSFFRFIS